MDDLYKTIIDEELEALGHPPWDQVRVDRFIAEYKSGYAGIGWLGSLNAALEMLREDLADRVGDRSDWERRTFTSPEAAEGFKDGLLYAEADEFVLYEAEIQLSALEPGRWDVVFHKKEG